MTRVEHPIERFRGYPSPQFETLFDGIYEESVFVFALAVPELVLLLMEVHEYDMSKKNNFGGKTCYTKKGQDISLFYFHDKFVAP
ncbi:hypothetical protein RJT34_20348 [Clitoria ternatea]|uniref:Uncharacterized protein n=1 Tax=Clitoria ternatea TaxID=43366 RepID=A0AAN9P540_CLITE